MAAAPTALLQKVADNQLAQTLGPRAFVTVVGVTTIPTMAFSDRTDWTCIVLSFFAMALVGLFFWDARRRRR